MGPLFDATSFRHVADREGAAGIAERCRHAALAFVNRVDEGWGGEELAYWLIGPYWRAVGEGLIDRDEVAPLLGAAMSDPKRILREAQRDTLLLLADLACSVRVPFVDWVISKRIVVPCFACGEGGWIPMALPGRDLFIAVGSLFAVDYLLRPEDYANALTVCRSCRAVLFDSEARIHGECGCNGAPRAAAAPRVALARAPNGTLRLPALADAERLAALQAAAAAARASKGTRRWVTLADTEPGVQLERRERAAE